MDDPTDGTVPGPDLAPATNAAVRGWRWPRLPLLIGVIGLGGAVTTGTLFHQRAKEEVRQEVAAVERQLEQKLEPLVAYRSRLADLQWRASKFRGDAAAATAEPLRSWTRERAVRFDAFVGEVEAASGAAELEGAANAVRAWCEQGKWIEARAMLGTLPAAGYPEPAMVQALQARHYLGPLAQFSRQNPAYYRAFQENEPEAAAKDIAALRRQLVAAGIENLTPQTMLGFELLSAVAPPDDPLVTDLGTVMTAEDFFEHPDAATLAHWRAARRAMRTADWPTAVARMQAIVKTKVRTRQPFRAAYGRALIRQSPENATAAYPFFEEAALAGDKEARAWVSTEDLAKDRLPSALRWLEARVGDGETEATVPLLSLYARPSAELPRNEATELELLQKIVAAPDAPPLAWMLLARRLEQGSQPSPEKAFAAYTRAAEAGYAPALLELARRARAGQGAPADPVAAAHWAARAYAAGEASAAVAMLLELMQTTPDQAAGAVQALLEHEQVASPAGYAETREQAGLVASLRLRLARHLDRQGKFGAAARFYSQAGAQDPGVQKRLAELTTARPCEACSGVGETTSWVACPTCGGKATRQCPACSGRGYTFKPGSPPCPTCGGAGGMVQDGRAVVCAACEGTGKGKASAVKEPCAHCASGRVPCGDCTGGRISVKKPCSNCRGTGSRSLAES